MNSVKMGILILLLSITAPVYATTISLAGDDAITPNAITNAFPGAIVSPNLIESTVCVTGTTTVNITRSNIADYGRALHTYTTTEVSLMSIRTVLVTASMSSETTWAPAVIQVTG